MPGAGRLVLLGVDRLAILACLVARVSSPSSVLIRRTPGVAEGQVGHLRIFLQFRLGGALVQAGLARARVTCCT